MRRMHVYSYFHECQDAFYKPLLRPFLHRQKVSAVVNRHQLCLRNVPFDLVGLVVRDQTIMGALRAFTGQKSLVMSDELGESRLT